MAPGNPASIAIDGKRSAIEEGREETDRDSGKVPVQTGQIDAMNYVDATTANLLKAWLPMKSWPTFTWAWMTTSRQKCFSAACWLKKMPL